MVTRVINIKDKKSFDIYIGRYNPRYGSSKWRNPFKIGKNGTREEVIIKYREYALNNSELMNRLPELKDKTLGCWCKPEPCHGDVLVELIDK